MSPNSHYSIGGFRRIEFGDLRRDSRLLLTRKTFYPESLKFDEDKEEAVGREVLRYNQWRLRMRM